MPTSIWGADVAEAFRAAASNRLRPVMVGDEVVQVASPLPSPADWRDVWIYFLLVDRFNNPDSPPRFAPWNGDHGVFQGGTLNGVREKLDYLRDLGAGAIWLSPVLKNCQYSDFTYHGYGIQDFLQVDPRFTSDPAAARADPRFGDSELQALVDAAHARGMYVILDIVLNHTGDVFEYEGHGSEAPWRSNPYPIRWRDETGQARPEWTEAPEASAPDGAVWPSELRRNGLFRRQGMGGEAGGDFASLKEVVTDYRGEAGEFLVRNILIRAHQYLIARYDIDGFRIDTLKYVERDFARIFGNAMREYALSIGKKNFLQFGEVYDSEEKIAHFVGRFASESADLVGVDAALDFPLFYKLPSVTKGLAAPSEVVQVYEHRKAVQKELVSSHGEASRFFVTFLDNHDQRSRFYYQDPQDPERFDDQMKLGLSCLFLLQGIPCLYYGTEQGLQGSGGSDTVVRQALWGKPSAFDESHAFYRVIRNLTDLRSSEPALRYGRQYFRPVSGNGSDFGMSLWPAGVLAFARILNDRELLVVANTNTSGPWHGDAIVDAALNPDGSTFEVLFSSKGEATPPGPVVAKASGSLRILEVNGSVTGGPASVLPVRLRPAELQVLARRL